MRQRFFVARDTFTYLSQARIVVLDNQTFQLLDAGHYTQMQGLKQPDYISCKYKQHIAIPICIDKHVSNLIAVLYEALSRRLKIKVSRLHAFMLET